MKYKNASEFAEDVFVRVVKKYWSSFHRDLLRGKISFSKSGCKVLYPNQMRICDTDDFYAVEFVGSASWENSLFFRKPNFNKVEKYQSLSKYLVPGIIPKDEPTTAAMNLIGQGTVSLTGLDFMTLDFLGIKKDKFFHVIPENRKSATILTDSQDALVRFGGEKPYIYLQDISFYSARNGTSYFRYFSLLLAAHKNTSKVIFRQELTKSIESTRRSGGVFGLAASSDQGKMQFITELESFADQGVKEAVLDNFLNEHADKFRKSLFGYADILPQVKLLWIKEVYKDFKKGKPDYLMIKDDGTFDILDVKQSLCSGKSLIKGISARRRFTDYVQELIAQLRTYEEYFSYAENLKFAQEKYGIKYDPSTVRLIGIVGNYDVLPEDETRKILGAYADKIHIINYNTLAKMAAAQI